MSTHSPPRRLKFFADENFSLNLVAILRIFSAHYRCPNGKMFSCEFVHYTDKFQRGLADEEWMPMVKREERDAVILSGDERILTNPIRRAVLEGSGLGFLGMAKSLGDLPFTEQVIKTLRAWDRVCIAVGKYKPPFMLILTMKGLVEEHGQHRASRRA